MSRIIKNVLLPRCLLDLLLCGPCVRDSAPDMHHCRVSAVKAALFAARVSPNDAETALLLRVCGIAGARRLLYNPRDFAAGVGDHLDVRLLPSADDMRLTGRVSVGGSVPPSGYSLGKVAVPVQELPRLSGLQPVPVQSAGG